MNLAHILVLIGILCLIIGCVIAPAPTPKKAEETVEASHVIRNCVSDGTVEGPTKITKPGVIIITQDRVVIDGFYMEGSDGDTAAAIRWGMDRLAEPLPPFEFKKAPSAQESE